MEPADLVPGAYPTTTSNDDSTSSSTATELRIPARWTSAVSVSPDTCPRSWHEREVPSELLEIRPNLNIPAKLLDIIQWSVQRTSVGEQIQIGSQTSNTPGPDFWVDDWRFPSTVEDDSTISSLNVQADSATRGSSTPSTPSNKKREGLPAQLKSDLASAITKVANFTTKHDRESKTSEKLTKFGTTQPATPPSTEECISCFEDLPLIELTKLSCSHHYCLPCLRTLVLTSIKSESSYPPKCCLTEIPPATVIGPLDKQQREQYKQKAAEYSIPVNRRWYCPNTACTKWIPPSSTRRMSGKNMKCPHCSTKICMTCRNVQHPENEECPQDFGLEATMSTAELQGWKRCYSCRTMVERREGCRHITCRCGAEFCYVCGARWRTCGCTEVDEVNRQNELRLQRQARETAQREEEEEVRRAIEMVEALERTEEEMRQQREAEIEAERRQEEEQLARLEEERQAELLKREEERAEAERQLVEVLKLSLQEDQNAVAQCLQTIMNDQHILFDDKHGKGEQELLASQTANDVEHDRVAQTLLKNIERNVERRTAALTEKHASQIKEMDAKLEEQEDDIFLQIQLHLKGKPNKEARERKLQEKLHISQKEERDGLESKQKRETEQLQNITKMEREGIEKSLEVKKARAHREQEDKMRKFSEQVAVERMWFTRVCERRVSMVEENSRRLLAEFEQGDEPTGLTEILANTIHPLPVRKPETGAKGSSRPSQVRESCHVDLIPVHGNDLTNMNDRGRLATAGVEYLQQQLTEEETMNSATAWIGSTGPLLLPRKPVPVSSQSHPLRDNGAFTKPEKKSLEDQQNAPSLTPISPPLPHNGNAFLSTKHGECSRPVWIPTSRPQPPPTPPASPECPTIVSQPAQRDHLQPQAKISTRPSQDSFQSDQISMRGEQVPPELRPRQSQPYAHAASYHDDTSTAASQTKVFSATEQEAQQWSWTEQSEAGDRKTRSARWPWRRKS